MLEDEISRLCNDNNLEELEGLHKEKTQKGEDISFEFHDDYVPIMEVLLAPNASYEMVNFLLKNGANPCEYDPKLKFFPLWNASYYCNKEIAELLIEFGADINQKNIYGANCLSNAFCSPKLDLNYVIFLIENGVDFYNKDEDGWNGFDYFKNNNKAYDDNLELRNLIESLYEKKYSKNELIKIIKKHSVEDSNDNDSILGLYFSGNSFLKFPKNKKELYKYCEENDYKLSIIKDIYNTTDLLKRIVKIYNEYKDDTFVFLSKFIDHMRASEGGIPLYEIILIRKGILRMEKCIQRDKIINDLEKEFYNYTDILKDICSEQMKKDNCNEMYKKMYMILKDSSLDYYDLELDKMIEFVNDNDEKKLKAYISKGYELNSPNILLCNIGLKRNK